MLVDRRNDRVAARVDVVLVEASRLEFLAHRHHEVAVCAAQGALTFVFDRLGEAELVGLLLRERARLIDLAIDHTLPQGLRFFGVLRGVVGTGRRNNGHEERGLGIIEFTRALAEVGLCRFFNAVRGEPEVDRVEVARKDLVLVELLVDFDGHDHFAHLAGIRRDLARVVVLDVLLGDRRSPLAGAA